MYDKSSSSNISLYTTTGTVNYDSTEQAYFYPSQNLAIMYRDSFIVDFDFELTVDFKILSKASNQTIYMGLSNEYGGNNNYDLQCQITPNSSKIGSWYRNTVAGQSINNNQQSCNYSINTWYTMKLTRQGTSFTVQILQNNTVIGSSTNTCADSRDTTSLRILSEKGNIYFANIKLKQL